VGLNDVLRAATADPPPSRIDLDALIAGERDRLRRQRWLSGVGAVTAGVAVFGVAAFGGLSGLGAPFASLGSKPEPPCPMLSPGTPAPPDANAPSGLPIGSPAEPTPYPGGSSGLPTSGASAFTGQPTMTGQSSGAPATDLGSPTPLSMASISARPMEPDASMSAEGQPTEACGVAARRFNRALTDGLHRTVPSATLTNAWDPKRPPVWFSRDGSGMFIAHVLVQTPAGSVDLGVTIGSDPFVPSREKLCDDTVNDGTDCTYTVDPDGTVVATRQAGTNREVTIFRPDHTVVQLFVMDSSKSVLTVNQLVAIGRDRAFTLFP
jgi:hypothetical protein